MPIYIIEHLEKRIWRWCIIEYKHISALVGKKNLWFTNIKMSEIAKTISEHAQKPLVFDRCKELSKYGKVIKKPVSELNLKNACVLDPEAKKILNPNEAKKIKYFIFGGILGDNPPKKRTKKELTGLMKNAIARSIGKKQFSTDNAVLVTKEIAKGALLGKMKFIDALNIKM